MRFDKANTKPGTLEAARKRRKRSAAAKQSRCGQWLIRPRAPLAQERSVRAGEGEGERASWEEWATAPASRERSLLQHNTATWSTVSSIVCSAAAGAGAALLHQWLWGLGSWRLRPCRDGAASVATTWHWVRGLWRCAGSNPAASGHARDLLNSSETGAAHSLTHQLMAALPEALR